MWRAKWSGGARAGGWRAAVRGAGRPLAHAARARSSGPIASPTAPFGTPPRGTPRTRRAAGSARRAWTAAPPGPAASLAAQNARAGPARKSRGASEIRKKEPDAIQIRGPGGPGAGDPFYSFRRSRPPFFSYDGGYEQVLDEEDVGTGVYGRYLQDAANRRWSLRLAASPSRAAPTSARADHGLRLGAREGRHALRGRPCSPVGCGGAPDRG